MIFLLKSADLYINCFDTEGDVLDSTDTVDTTDCVVLVIKEMMEELDYDSIFLTSIAFSIIKEKYNKNLSETLLEVNQAVVCLVL